MIRGFSSLAGSLGSCHAGDWSDEQNDALAADYFAMLADDIIGRPYSKAEHNRLPQAVINRPRGSIEIQASEHQRGTQGAR